MVTILTLHLSLIFSLALCQSLTITCGGEKDRLAFDSSSFGGCFVTQNDITYEILGKPPLNISGSYGQMVMNKSNNCEIRFNLKYKFEGEFKCGVIFLGPRNQTIKAIFSHFIFTKIAATSLDPSRAFPTLNLSDIRKTSRQVESLQSHAIEIKVTIIILILLISVFGCVLIIFTLMKQTRKKSEIRMKSINPDRCTTIPSSYPISPRQRNEANQTLSSLELISAPSPPPLSLSFAHVQPFIYPDSDAS